MKKALKMKKYLPLFVTSALILLVCVQCNNNPILTIDGGRITGLETETPGVYVYKGIPYAAPPVGELRWKEPQPVIPWDGIKVADTFGPAAIQNDQVPGSFYQKEFFFDGDPVRSEDCLYLNIWTPAPGQPDKKLPVAMWIHGGAYMQGFGHEPEFDGEEWAKRNVILVTINYRLGMPGFLAHPLLTEESPNHTSGNYGILDQVAALKWIKNNILQFGGDPDNLTIFGQSAGAGSVKTLVSSPLTTDVVQKAIIQSSGGLSGLGFDNPLDSAEKTGKEITDLAKLSTLKEMRAYPADSLLKLLSKYMEIKKRWFMLSPNVDGYVTNNSFSNLAKAGKLPDIPFMIGQTGNDMGNMALSIADFCLLLEEQGHQPAYSYSFIRPLPGDSAGAFHSSELWYIFGTLDRCWRPLTEEDHVLSQKMIDYWTNFAKYDDPKGTTYTDWKPYTKDSRYIEILDIEKNP
jgi:para-nitrobenzyl esterase